MQAEMMMMMMGEDLGVEAKESAAREVAKLLPLPELLYFIASIKADYITRQQVVSYLYNEEKMNVLVEPELHDIFARIPGFGFIQTYYTQDTRPVILPDSARLELKIPEDAWSNAWVSFDGKRRQELSKGTFN